MKQVYVGLLMCVVLHTIAKEANHLSSFPMQSSSAYIGVSSFQSVYTVGFAMPFEKECRKDMQFRGICYGSGEYGSELARLTALFFQQELSHSHLAQDVCFMEAAGISGDFTYYMRSLFHKAHKHLLQKMPRDLENSSCQVALIYHNAYLNYMASVQLGTESMIAYEGNNGSSCITLQEGGLEKCAEPSICSFVKNLPRVVLVGAPQVVNFLFPHLVKCVEADRKKYLTSVIRAKDIWEYATRRQRFQGDPTNCGDFQLLARNNIK